MPEDLEFMEHIVEFNDLAAKATPKPDNYEIYQTGQTTSTPISADSVTFEGGAAVFRLGGKVRQAFAPGAWTYLFRSHPL